MLLFQLKKEDVNVAISVLVSRFQSFIVASSDPLAKRVPWGLNATE